MFDLLLVFLSFLFTKNIYKILYVQKVSFNIMQNNNNNNSNDNFRLFKLYIIIILNHF